MKKPALRFKEFDEEWVEKKIVDVAPLQRGFDLPNSQLKPGSVPVVCSNGIVAYHNTSKCCAPGLVTGRSGTIGKFTLISEGYYWPHNTSLWVTDFKKNLPVFISYLYQTIQIEKYATGSGVPTLNRNDVHEHKCFISIDKAEQAAIGSFFTELDSLIEGKRVKLDKLKKLKLAYLGKMFPKKGARVPEIRFKGFSGDWEEKRLDELFVKGGSGGTPSTRIAEYYMGSIPFLSITDITNSVGLIYDTEKHITEDALKASAAWMVPSEAISLAMYASVGKVAIIKCSLATSQAFFNMVITNMATRDFVFHYLKRMEEFSEWNQLISTGTQSNLNAEKVKSLKISIPKNPDEQGKIGTLFSSMDRLISLQQQELDKLSNIKSACLSKMFA